MGGACANMAALDRVSYGGPNYSKQVPWSTCARAKPLRLNEPMPNSARPCRSPTSVLPFWLASTQIFRALKWASAAGSAAICAVLKAAVYSVVSANLWSLVKPRNAVVLSARNSALSMAATCAVPSACV